MGVIQLVRHGQASFGTDDYDRLSPLGHLQGAELGRAWKDRRIPLGVVVEGSMLRHRQTRTAVFAGAGAEDGAEDAEVLVEPGWDEYDLKPIVDDVDPLAWHSSTVDFQRVLNVALGRWQAGAATGPERFASFEGRVLGAFRDVVDSAGPGRWVTVFTSSGPIALLVSHLLVGDASLFQRLNDVMVNAGVTTMLSGATGPRLLAFNDHAHLDSAVVTYR